MAHPRYRIGKEIVPSVTTVLGSFKESGGLIQWAYKLGLEGKDMDAERDGAASAGTIAHAMAEADFNGRDPELNLPAPESLGVTEEEYAPMLEKARVGFANFQRWKQAVEMRVIATEVSLVHPEHRFGGTLDFAAEAWGKLVLGDLKTSNRVYDEHLIQCAAYTILWEEGRLNDGLGLVPPRFGERMDEIVILRLSKDDAAFSFHSFNGEIVQHARDQFLDFRRCYERRKRLKKAVGQ
jgi:hypothetical protein